MPGSTRSDTPPKSPDLAAIQAAQQRLGGHIVHTALRPAPSLSQKGTAVYLKLENHQKTGSFKLRGATNAVLNLDEQGRTRGLVTASTGNHGRALAHAGRAAGVPVTVCMSDLVPSDKVSAVQELAEIRIAGHSQDDAQAEVARLVQTRGLVEIPPFDHPDVIAGQGTLGLEIVAALPGVASVLVPLSGGGLAAGVAAAVKGLRPGTRVIGISTERCPAMHASLAAGRPVAVEEQPSLADSLGGGIGLRNRHTFAMCRNLLDDVVCLNEDEIAAGLRHAVRTEGEAVEGAGVVGIAALLSGKVPVGTGPMVVIISGGNIDPARLTELRHHL